MTLELVLIVAIFMLLFGYRWLPRLGRALATAPERFDEGLNKTENQ